MKKFLVVGFILFVAIAVAAPSMAAKLDFSYGGQIRTRVFSQSNFQGFDADDDSFRWDYRMRLYFTYTASENLKLVTKFEVGDVVAGGPNTTGRVGADGKDIEVKNAYVDFNIPNGLLPLNLKAGTQGLVFFDSWIIDDDFTGAYLSTTMDATKVGVGFIKAQEPDTFSTELDIEDYFLHVDYKCAPWFVSFMAFAQAGHDTAVSADPATLSTPVVGTIGRNITTDSNFFRRALLAPNSVLPADFVKAGHNNLIDLGLTAKYKTDVWSAYLTFVKNLGKVDFKRYREDGSSIETVTSDYTGWMVDAGGSYYCGPWTFSLGGFYTTGPDDVESSLRGGRPNTDIDWYTYPLATSKYFSEIIGGGIFDNTAPAHEDLQWRGYGFPTNLWTVNVGAAWQVLPDTKLAFGYWYFSTAEDVVSDIRGFNDNGFLNVDLDTSIGHEFNLNLTQKVVDGLMLDVVAAYLIADDAYSVTGDDDDAIELGARLQWSF
jgi:hypothetical protein